MEQFKKTQVIMLPTNKPQEAQGLGIYHNKLYKYQHKDYWGMPQQHLYIISDDEIKEDDWYILFNPDSPLTILKCTGDGDYFNCKKIIATTDTLLKIFAGRGDICDLYYNLPQPSQEFIEKYIESYNKSEVITDVLVEYELCKFKYDLYNDDIREERQNYIEPLQSKNDLLFSYIKINSNNTINIRH